jgi:hypothetical protein
MKRWGADTKRKPACSNQWLVRRAREPNLYGKCRVGRESFRLVVVPTLRAVPPEMMIKVFSPCRSTGLRQSEQPPALGSAFLLQGMQNTLLTLRQHRPNFFEHAIAQVDELSFLLCG